MHRDVADHIRKLSLTECNSPLRPVPGLAEPAAALMAVFSPSGGHTSWVLGVHGSPALVLVCKCGHRAAIAAEMKNSALPLCVLDWHVPWRQ